MRVNFPRRKNAAPRRDDRIHNYVRLLNNYARQSFNGSIFGIMYFLTDSQSQREQHLTDIGLHILHRMYLQATLIVCLFMLNSCVIRIQYVRVNGSIHEYWSLDNESGRRKD